MEKFKFLQNSLGLSQEELFTQRQILPIHPSFRIIATANSTEFSPDALEMFQFHTMSFPSLSDAKTPWRELLTDTTNFLF
jgi:hypothetical protein